MDSMDCKKDLEELGGHKLKNYNVWIVHLISKKKETICSNSHLIIFKNSQKKTTKQGPYLIKGKIVNEVCSLCY